MTPPYERSELLDNDSHLIETYWPRLQQVLEPEVFTFKKSVVRPVKNQKGLFETHADFETLSDAEVKIKLKENPLANIWFLRDAVKAAATETLLQFCAEQERAADSSHYLRVKEIVGSEKVSKGLDPAFWVLAHIHKGLNSGIYAGFDVLRVLPLAYAQATGESPTAEEFRSIAQKSQALLMQLASMDIRSYVSLRDGAKEHFREELPSWRKHLDYEFPREFFVFSVQSGQLQMQPQFFQKWKEGYQAPVPAFRGCPARLSKVDPRTNAVINLYVLQTEIFFRYFVPFLRDYVESGKVK